MPLESGPAGSKAFRENIATEIKAGKPPAQAAAIAYRTAGERKDADPHNVHGYMDACVRGDVEAQMKHSFKDRR